MPLGKRSGGVRARGATRRVESAAFELIQLLSCPRRRNAPSWLWPALSSVGLSGVTPGDREDLRFRRVSGNCAAAQNGSRRVRLVGAFRRRLSCRTGRLFSVLARAFLASEPTVEAGDCPRRPYAWQALAMASPAGPAIYRDAYADRTRPRRRDVVRFLLEDSGFARAWSKYSRELARGAMVPEPQQMQPVAGGRNVGCTAPLNP